MTFDLSYPTTSNRSPLQLTHGEVLFVLGANGTGKSSLMVHFAQQNQNNMRKLPAHRQTWIESDSINLTPASKVQKIQNFREYEADLSSRYIDFWDQGSRPGATIYEIIEAHNIRARRIANFVDSGLSAAAAAAAKREAPPITVINDFFRRSNMPIEISIHENSSLMASKDSGQIYGVSELSDGERNALLIAGDVLTAPSGALLIIDEPEQHLHRSIIAPLLIQLFEHRADCGFVISTHDSDLPLYFPKSSVLLLRSFDMSDMDEFRWEADELPGDTVIDDNLKRDLLGARRTVVFVEGTIRSMDKPLYSLVFPMVSIIPRGSFRDVERAVVGLQAAKELHWLRAFGIVDGDGYTRDEVRRKLDRGIYTLPFYSVEAIYYHPQIIEWVANRQASVSGEDASVLAEKAVSEGINAIAAHTERLCKISVKRTIRRTIYEHIPGDDELLAGAPLSIENSAATIWDERKNELESAVSARDWAAILERVPVRDTPALTRIAETLGFRETLRYERAVIHLLTEDGSALAFVRELFADLLDQVTANDRLP